VLEWLNNSKAENTNSIQTNLALAQYHTASGQLEEAIAAIGAINKADQPASHVAELHVASMLNNQRFDDAIVELDDLLQQSPGSPKWYFLRAQAYAGKSDYEQTTVDLEQALAFAPNHAPSLLALANLKISLNDLPSAEGYIKTLESLEPNNDGLSAVKAKLTQAKLVASEQSNKRQ